MDLHLTAVYRFRYPSAWEPVSPERMWGTLEAIASLEGCEPMIETRREVLEIKLDRHGFFFDMADAVTLRSPVFLVAV